MLIGLFLVTRPLPSHLKKVLLTGSAPPDILIALILIPNSIIFYTMIISTMFEVGNPRYRTPSDLLIYFVTVLGIQILARYRENIKKALAAYRDIY